MNAPAPTVAKAHVDGDATALRARLADKPAPEGRSRCGGQQVADVDGGHE